MQLPLQITYRHMDPSPALDARIRQLASRLERFSPQIMHCHVTVEAPHRHHRQGKLFDVRIDLTVPGHEIAIQRGSVADHAHEDAFVALRDAFRAARRKLQDYERERYGKVKLHTGQPHGQVSELHPDEDYGRIDTPEGRSIYFHRHSVLGGAFDNLGVGTEVRFAEEQGDRGPQASTVCIVS
jgi:cold shock CspA family protein/ribosome-associated translation inhibitor RaiA